MVVAGIPEVATIGVSRTWITAIAGYGSLDYDLKWLIGETEIRGVAQLPPLAGWTTNFGFVGFGLGQCAWSMAVINKLTQVETPILMGSVFLETQEYTGLRQQLEAVDAALLNILKNGGNQTISIKGRSTTKYGLADLRTLRSQLASQLNNMRGNSGAVLINFGSHAY